MQVRCQYVQVLSVYGADCKVYPSSERQFNKLQMFFYFLAEHFDELFTLLTQFVYIICITHRLSHRAAHSYTYKKNAIKQS